MCTDYWSAKFRESIEAIFERSALSSYVEEKGFIRPKPQAKFTEEKTKKRQL